HGLGTAAARRRRHRRRRLGRHHPALAPAAGRPGAQPGRLPGVLAPHHRTAVDPQPLGRRRHRVRPPQRRDRQLLLRRGRGGEGRHREPGGVPGRGRQLRRLLTRGPAAGAQWRHAMPWGTRPMRCIALLLAALTGLQAAPVYGRQDAGGAPGFDPLVLERAALLPLASTAPKVALSLPAGEAAFYYIDLPSNVATLSVSTSGSGGDADLFVRQGIPHTGSSIQQLVAESIGTSAHGGNLEMLTVGRNDGLEPGRWWILVLNLGSTAAQLEVNASFSTAGSPFVA